MSEKKSRETKLLEAFRELVDEIRLKLHEIDEKLNYLIKSPPTFHCPTNPFDSVETDSRD